MRKSTIAALSALALGIIAPGTAAAQETAPAADAASLEAARVTVDHVFPTGTYARVMDKTMDAMMGPMMDSMGEMPMGAIASAAGLSEEDVAQLGDSTMREVMELLDPAYRQRMDLGMRAMMSEMTAMMTTVEPAIRQGLAQAYAKRYTPAQLAELNAFFATPTGGAYAADSMLIFMDPEVMGAMQGFIPQMMEQMPDIIAKVETATADLPPPRSLDDLTATERERLGQLLGVPADELGNHAAGDDAAD